LNESSLTRGCERTRTPSTTVTTAVSTSVPPCVVDGAAVAVGRAVMLAVGDEVTVGLTVGTRVSVEAAAEDVGGDGASEADGALQPTKMTTVLSRTMTVRRFLPRIAYLSRDLWTSWFRRLNGLPCSHCVSRGRLVRRKVNLRRPRPIDVTADAAASIQHPRCTSLPRRDRSTCHRWSGTGVAPMVISRS
jgi:hypothetical protein